MAIYHQRVNQHHPQIGQFCWRGESSAWESPEKRRLMEPKASANAYRRRSPRNGPKDWQVSA